MKKKDGGSRTLLWSVIMSAPGPLVVGLGLLTGRSSTQIADFVRRSAELLAILMAFVTYRITTGKKPYSPGQKAAVERFSNRFVGAMMCLGGTVMIVLALLPAAAEKGNVVPGLVIALLGVTANTIFWRKYTHLNRKEPNPVLAVQARLYRAKSLVDLCVTTALLSVFLAPHSPVSGFLDKTGSIIVAAYLIFCGIQTIWETLRTKPAP